MNMKSIVVTRRPRADVLVKGRSAGVADSTLQLRKTNTTCPSPPMCPASVRRTSPRCRRGRVVGHAIRAGPIKTSSIAKPVAALRREISSENGATDAFAGPAARSRRGGRRRRRGACLRLSAGPSFRAGRAAASNSSAGERRNKAQTHAETAAAPSDRQLLSSSRLLAVAAPSSRTTRQSSASPSRAPRRPKRRRGAAPSAWNSKSDCRGRPPSRAPPSSGPARRRGGRQRACARVCAPMELLMRATAARRFFSR